jgi:hypothetical protein
VNKSYLFLCVLLTLGSCFAPQSQPQTQLGARYDSNAQINSNGTLLVIPRPLVVVCTYGSTVSNCGQNSATTYTDGTLTVACPTSAPLVLNQTNTCVANGDADGNFGFWVAPQTTYSYSVAGTGAATKLYSFTAGGNTSGAGSAAASIAVTPSSFNFGSQQTGASAPVQAITISNTSATAQVIINSVSFSGTVGIFSSTQATACNVSLAAGASCVLLATFTPAAVGLQTSTLTVNSSAPVDATNPPTSVLSGTGTAAATFPLSLNGSGTGAGTVQSDGSPALNCVIAPPAPPKGQCSLSYTTGSNVVLTATAAGGSSFSTFSGCGLSVSPGTCTVTAATTVNSSFNLSTAAYAVSFTGVGQGGGTIVSDVATTGGNGILNCALTAGVLASGGNAGCAGGFTQGKVVTLTESPNGSSTFLGWSGPCSGTATTCVFAVNATTVVTANFTPSTVPLSKADQWYVTGTAAATTISGIFTTQHAGGMNVCFITPSGNTVSTVTDTAGNTWAAANTLTTNGSIHQVAWATNNIAAAATNTVTVTYSGSTTFRSLRCLSYDGVITGGGYIDQTANANGSGTAAAAGNLTTTVGNDLLVCGTTSAQNVQTPDALYQQVVLDAPYNDDAEQRLGVPIATYNCQPTISPTASWVSQNIAFKAQQTTGGLSTYSVTVTGGSSGFGTVAIAGNTCTVSPTGTTGTCSVQVAPNSSLTLTAAPQSGSSFAGWTGSTGCSSSANCILPNITGNATLTANFSLSGVQSYYVNQSTGSDFNNSGLCAVAGTPAGCTGPWASLQKADAANIVLGQNGTQVNVADGTYNVANLITHNSGTASARLVYKSTNKWGAKLVATGCSVWRQQGDYVDVNGFDMTGNCSNGLSWEGSYGNALNNKVHDLPGTGGFGGIVLGNSNYNTTGNTVAGNIVDNIGPFGAINTIHGIYVAGPQNFVFNNIVSRAAAACITTYHNATREAISNNTVMNCGKYGIQISADGALTANDYSTVANNIVVNVAGLGIQEFPAVGAHNVYLNNIVYGNTGGNFALRGGTQSGSITLTTAQFNALFVSYSSGNAQTGNFHLNAGTAGVNAGTTQCAVAPGLQGCVPLLDFDGVVRPQGISFDVGAYEQ